MINSSNNDILRTASKRHAYLILVHHEFEVLKHLITALDDVRNDIYIHYDLKVQQLPLIETKQANLIILQDREDVRWGDVSVVSAEFLLFEQAHQNADYTYYHLISGVDMPLHSQDHIHSFFEMNNGKEFIGYSNGGLQAHIARKVQYDHLFSRHFRSNKSVLSYMMKVLRFLWLRLQLVLGLKRNTEINFKKGTQWVSLTHDFVSYMLTQKEAVFRTYQSTFCADEIVIQTICWNSPFRDAIYDTENEGSGSQRLIQWVDNQIFDWTLKDLPTLLTSDLLFARKFNSGCPELFIRLSDHIKSVK